MRYFRLCTECGDCKQVKHASSAIYTICRECSYKKQNKTKQDDYRRTRRKTYSQVGVDGRRKKDITNKIIPQKVEIEKSESKEEIKIRKMSDNELMLIEEWRKRNGK